MLTAKDQTPAKNQQSDFDSFYFFTMIKFKHELKATIRWNSNTAHCRWQRADELYYFTSYIKLSNAANLYSTSNNIKSSFTEKLLF